MKYPLLRVPEMVTDIYDSEIPIPKKPIEPKKPTISDYDDDGWAFSFISIGIVVGIIFIIGAIFNRKTDNPWSGLSIGFFIIFFFGIAYNFVSNKNKKSHEKYNSESKKYQELLREYKLLFDIYQNKMNDYEKEVEFIGDYKSNYKSKKIANYFKESREKLHLTSGDVKNKGVVVPYFLGYLQKHFSDFNLRAVTINIDKYNYKYKLISDIFMVHSEGIMIDVEIDEPYVGSTKEPINYKEFGNMDRDNMLSTHGIITIRFTEEQVVVFPKKCCEFIRQFVDKLINGFVCNNIEIESFDKTPVWFYEKCVNMANKDFRKSYLPDKVWDKLEVEKLEGLADIKRKDYKVENIKYTGDLPF